DLAGSRTGCSQDVDLAVGVEVGDGDANTVEPDAERREVAALSAVAGAERADMRRGSLPLRHDDVGFPVAVQVAGGHEDAAGEGACECEEAVDVREVRAVENANMWAAAGAGSGNNVRLAVAGDVTGRDAHAAGKSRAVGEEAVQHVVRRSVENLDMRPAAGAGAGHDLGLSVVVEIAD